MLKNISKNSSENLLVYPIVICYGNIFAAVLITNRHAGLTKKFRFQHNGIKMKSFAKLPLYMGLAVLVFSVLISVAKVGSQQAMTSQKTKASAGGAGLSMQFTPPNLVSVLLTSEKEVAGVDMMVKFNGSEVTILPSSLSGGVSFVTSGGNMDVKANTFTFSAIAKKTPVSNGIVATFSVVPAAGKISANADLQFAGEGTTTDVVDKVSKQNILGNTQGVKFTTSAR